MRFDTRLLQNLHVWQRLSRMAGFQVHALLGPKHHSVCTIYKVLAMLCSCTMLTGQSCSAESDHDMRTAGQPEVDPYGQLVRQVEACLASCGPYCCRKVHISGSAARRAAGVERQAIRSQYWRFVEGISCAFSSTHCPKPWKGRYCQ
jgi:hypothetical protein